MTAVLSLLVLFNLDLGLSNERLISFWKAA